MNKLYFPIKPKPAEPVNFEVSYEDPHGNILHAVVKQITNDDFQVYIKEKEVVIQCTTDEEGVFSCKLTMNRNPVWIDGVTREIGKRINKTR